MQISWYDFEIHRKENLEMQEKIIGIKLSLIIMFLIMIIMKKHQETLEIETI